jgi:hypothetical protein
MPEFDLEHPPWSEEAGGTGDSDDWGDEQDRSEWFADAAHHWADRARKAESKLARIWIAIWSDSDGWNAQAYLTEEAARRDFPTDGSRDDLDSIVIVPSTVQP